MNSWPKNSPISKDIKRLFKLVPKLSIMAKEAEKYLDRYTKKGLNGKVTNPKSK